MVENSAGLLEGVEAVIDKDMVSALLAKQLGADGLIILTDGALQTVLKMPNVLYRKTIKMCQMALRNRFWCRRRHLRELWEAGRARDVAGYTRSSG